MAQTSPENGSFKSENVNNVHLNNLIPLMNDGLPPLSGVSHGCELLQLPKCLHSLKILFISTGFLPMIPCTNQSKLIILYTYFYRITLLCMPFYVLGVFSKQSNPLFASISRSNETMVTISFCLLILNVFVTILFCIKYFKKRYLTLLYHSLAIDLNSDMHDYCAKCLTLKKSSDRIAIIVLIFTTIAFIEWIIGNRYLQSLSSHSHSNIFYTYLIPLLWALQIWLPLFNCVSLLYIIGCLLKFKSDILIGRIHSSSARNWKISSIISKHPYSSIDSDKLQPFNSWWEVMDSYIKLVTEFAYISSKWNVYLSITVVVIISQSITVVIMLLQSSQLLVVAFIFSFQFILIFCVMFFVLARLSKQSNRILKIISMTDFGERIDQIEVIRIMELIKTNPCTITIYGIKVTHGKAAFFAGTIISFVSGSFTKFLIDSLRGN